MATQQQSKSRAVRAKLTHPVIDSDGHTVEFEPALHDSIKQVGGASVLERYLAQPAAVAGIAGLPKNGVNITPSVRLGGRCRPRIRLIAPPLCCRNCSYERLDEMGLISLVVYPTTGLFVPHLDDEEIRRAGLPSVQHFHADMFRDTATVSFRSRYSYAHAARSDRRTGVRSDDVGHESHNHGRACPATYAGEARTAPEAAR